MRYLIDVIWEARASVCPPFQEGLGECQPICQLCSSPTDSRLWPEASINLMPSRGVVSLPLFLCQAKSVATLPLPAERLTERGMTKREASAACLPPRKSPRQLWPRMPARSTADLKHPLEGDDRPAGRVLINSNNINRATRLQLFQAPAEMGQVNPVHRGAHTDGR
jgi:hypothetical protein